MVYVGRIGVGGGENSSSFWGVKKYVNMSHLEGCYD